MPYKITQGIKEDGSLDEMTPKLWRRTRFYYMEFCYRAGYIISQNIENLSKGVNLKETERAVVYSEHQRQKMIKLSLMRRLDERINRPGVSDKTFYCIFGICFATLVAGIAVCVSHMQDDD